MRYRIAVCLLTFMPLTAVAADMNQAANAFFGDNIVPPIEDGAQATTQPSPSISEKSENPAQEKRFFMRLPTIDEAEKAQIKQFKAERKQQSELSIEEQKRRAQSREMYNALPEEQKQLLRHIKQQRNAGN